MNYTKVDLEKMYLLGVLSLNLSIDELSYILEKQRENKSIEKAIELINNAKETTES